IVEVVQTSLIVVRRNSCTFWNFSPRVNLARTSLDVVRTRSYVSRVGNQLSQSRLNEFGVVRTSFAEARV
ncbi:hypothetical protein GIB67_021855, partial [Kingdonia uniflora]